VKCRGIHCEGCCGHGTGGAGGLAAAALLVIIIAAAVKERHAITAVIEIVGYVLAIAAGGAVAGLAGYGVWRTRQHVLEVRDRRISPQVRAVITSARTGRPVPGLIAPRPAPGQIEPHAWRPGQPWELAEPARHPELAYGRSLIGDADRDWLTAMLREHYAAGRLSLAELRRRVTVVLSVRYADEAADALADLPRMPWGDQ
jgi:Domain of unknown function (DUF1707)